MERQQQGNLFHEAIGRLATAAALAVMRKVAGFDPTTRVGSAPT